ncbi:hypothetical protein RJZ90_006714 [Blastomyces dermatitidis]
MRPRPEHEMYRHPTPPPLEGFSEKLEADEFPVAPISEFEDELTPEEERRLVWKLVKIQCSALEGLLTIIVGFLFLALFPKDPDNPISMFGYRYFTEREAAFLSRRVLADDPKKEKGGNSISLKQLKGAVTNWKMYPHLFVTISGLAPIYVFGAYAPTLVASFGFERLVSNALLGCRVLVYSPDGNLRFALLTLAIAFCAVWQPVNASWMSMNCRSPEERSIAMALFTMATNVAGIVASHVFQQEDRPLTWY